MRGPSARADLRAILRARLVLVAAAAGAVLALFDCSDAEHMGPRPAASCCGTVSSNVPAIPHGAPNEPAGQMCVVCHTCGDDTTTGLVAPLIDRTHDVCNACHGPDGGVVVHMDASCQWQMDCDTVPPQVNCDECHTVEYVNDLCQACHQEQC